MANTIVLAGRAVEDAKLKTVGDSQVLEFRYASDVGYGKKKTSNFFNVALWGKQGTNMAAHIVKGKELFISGELSTSEYDKKDGTKGYSLDIRANGVNFIGSKGGAGTPTNGTPASSDSDLSF